MNRLLGFAGAVLVAVLVFLPETASAQVFPGNSDVTCNLFDLSGVAPTKCSGFWSGNLNTVGAGNTSSAAQDAALAALGVTNPVTVLQKFDVVDGSAFADFAGSLFGVTVVSFHWGNGVFNTNYPNSANESRTAFYLFDASSTIDGKVYFSTMMRQSISNATLFYTGKDPGSPPQEVVPEPATMSLLAMGLAGMAAASRRRRKQ